MAIPRFYVSKDIGARGIAKLGTLNVPYNKIAKVFGPPCLSEAAGDSFDGMETAAWRFKFENGYVGEINDINGFGQKQDYKLCTSWNIYGHDPIVLEYVKAYIR